MLNSSTVDPTATTVPAYSCPMTCWQSNGGFPSTIAGNPRCRISRSVPQIATASTLTSASARSGRGTGFVTGRRSSGANKAHAFIIAGIWPMAGACLSTESSSWAANPVDSKTSPSCSGVRPAHPRLPSPQPMGVRPRASPAGELPIEDACVSWQKMMKWSVPAIRTSCRGGVDGILALS